MSEHQAARLPVAHVPPRCPPFIEANTVEALLPYLDAIAKRKYSQGLHSAWDLTPGERVLVYADNWYDPLCIEAIKQTLKNHGCTYEFKWTDRGPLPTLDGHDEIEMMRNLTDSINTAMGEWKEFERDGRYDKILYGYAGPILTDSNLRVQRMMFATPEMVANSANLFPMPILEALDEWTWSRIRAARRIHIKDPEGTDLIYTNHDEFWSDDRTLFNPRSIERWYPENQSYWGTNLPGHVWGRPPFMLAQEFEDGNGVMAGTMNHVGPFPHLRLEVANSKVTEIEGGGLFGEKLRAIAEEAKNLSYPEHPGKGILWWMEASIGTHPKIHRPRKDYLRGLACALYERMRSGVIHLGFGTITTSAPESEAQAAGYPIGHWHIHLYFPTVRLEMEGGGEEVLIRDGRLMGLEDPGIRELAAQYGDPDELLDEDWIPAVPGLNVEGDYYRDYASNPTEWTLTELLVCRRWHHLYMKMVGAEHAPHHH